MDLHSRKRIDIIVEAVILPRLLERLDGLDVTGYTVLPALAGRGRGGSWSADGQATMAGGMVSVSVITGEDRLEAVLTPVFALVRRQMGIVTVSDVQVLRADHF